MLTDICVWGNVHMHTFLRISHNIDKQLLNLCDLLVSNMNYSSCGTKPLVGLQQLMSIPHSYHTWWPSEASLAVMPVHPPKDSPPAESLTILAHGTKELALSQDPAITTHTWELPGDLEASVISQWAFHISTGHHRTSSLTPWSWLKFLSLRLPGFCLWSLNLGAVICQPR